MAVDKKILTIQDISCVGQCSLTVALPIVSARGVEESRTRGAAPRGVGGFCVQICT